MGVLALLLVVGTQVLDWYWPVGVFGVALVLGVWRTLRRMPGEYRVLQQVDARLRFNDALSTAYYYEKLARPGAGNPEFREAQRNVAERMARGADPRQAEPFELPRSAYIAVFALLGAASVFGLRYGVTRSLDLRPPVTAALFDFFRPSDEMVRAWETPPPDDAELAAEQPAPRQERRERKFDSESDARLTAMDATSDSGDRLTPAADRPLDRNDAWDESATRESGDAESAPPPPGMEPVTDQNGEEAPEFPAQEESDLIRRMQDAFANLLNKLNIPEGAGKSKRMTAGRRESDVGQGEKSEQQMEQKSDAAPEGEGQPTPNPQGEQADSNAQMAQAGQGEGEGKKSDQPGEQASRAGAGEKDGEKALRAARQAEAMGKLEEILGERADKIKGDIMVEVSSSSQRLRTRYSESDATHSAADVEVLRDEVPLNLQPYVQRYFDEIRKSEAATR